MKTNQLCKNSSKGYTLTPNKRLARHLQREFCGTKSTQSETAWLTPRIFPLLRWLTQLWEQNLDPRPILTPFQEELLWQKQLTMTPELNNENFIALAREFHSLLHDWQIPLNHPLLTNEENRHFLHLYQEFCASYTDNWITACELPSLLTAFPFDHSATITLAGFDEIPPQQQMALHKIRQWGNSVLEWDPNQQISSRKQRLAFANAELEIIAAAAWSHKILQENPDAKIGIIVPNLLATRPAMLPIFDETIADTARFNFSLGEQLSEIPIVQVALQLLSLGDPSQPSVIPQLLQSPYLMGSHQEWSSRILLSNTPQLTKLFHAEIPDRQEHSSLLQQLQHTPLLANNLTTWRSALDQIKNRQLYPSQWPATFVQLLQIWGWPGTEPLSKIEQAAVQHLMKIFSQLRQADPLTGKVSYLQALRHLKSLASTTLIQPTSEQDTSINILGMLEGAGLNFDYLWILGLAENSWPTHPNPNPLIPQRLQNQYNLPHASLLREHQFAQTLLARYYRSAPEIICSYVNQEEDRELAPSPLIRELPEGQLSQWLPSMPIRRATQIYHQRRWECLVDHDAPPISRSAIRPGNARLLELQAQCPFRAFGEFRLHLRAPTILTPGISAVERGTIIHRTLETLWQQLKNHEQLWEMTTPERNALLIQHLDAAIQKHSQPSRLQHLERQYLLPLLTNWLAIETQREPFRIVALEQSYEIFLDRLPIKLRTDRLDQAAQELILIDYKTGKKFPASRDWFVERLLQPQLPLYCLAIPTIESLAIAHLHGAKPRLYQWRLDELQNDWEKFTKASDAPPPPNPLREHWRKALTNLATELLQGHAAPTPHSPRICQYCHLSGLCRIKH